jgi:hypothetical protein
MVLGSAKQQSDARAQPAAAHAPDDEDDDRGMK